MRDESACSVDFMHVIFVMKMVWITGPGPHNLAYPVQNDDARDPDWGPAVGSVCPSALSDEGSSEPHEDYHLQNLHGKHINVVDES